MKHFTHEQTCNLREIEAVLGLDGRVSLRAHDAEAHEDCDITVYAGQKCIGAFPLTSANALLSLSPRVAAEIVMAMAHAYWSGERNGRDAA